MPFILVFILPFFATTAMLQYNRGEFSAVVFQESPSLTWNGEFDDPGYTCTVAGAFP